MMKKNKQHGFTLLELLVALTIFALISVMAYAGLQTVLESRDRITEQSRKLAELQLAFTILSRDIQLAVPRPVRDSFGDNQSAFASGTSSGLLSLTHNGNINLTEQAKSDLQRVSYVLEDGQFKRRIMKVLDGANEDNTAEFVLLNNVTNIDIRMLDSEGVWKSDWEQTDVLINMPRAIEINVELEGWGTIRRLIALTDQ